MWSLPLYQAGRLLAMVLLPRWGSRLPHLCLSAERKFDRRQTSDEFGTAFWPRIKFYQLLFSTLRKLRV